MEKGLLLEIDGLYGDYKGGLLNGTLIELLKKANKNLFKSYNNHIKEDVFNIDKFLLIKDINLDENGDFVVKLTEINDLFDEFGFTKINFYKINEVFYNVENKKTLIEQQLNNSKLFDNFLKFELEDFKYVEEKNYDKEIIIASHSFHNNVKKRYLIKSLSDINNFNPNNIYTFTENLFLKEYSFFDFDGKELIQKNRKTILKDFYYIHDMDIIDFLIYIIKDIEPKKTLENVYYSLETRTNYGVNGYNFDPININDIQYVFTNLIYSKALIVKNKEVNINKKFIKKIKSYFEPYKLELIEDFDFSESILLEKTISVKDKDSSFKLLNEKTIYKKKGKNDLYK